MEFVKNEIINYLLKIWNPNLKILIYGIIPNNGQFGLNPKKSTNNQDK